MNAIELIQRLHQHKNWVSHNLIQTSRELSEEQLKKEFPIGQSSIWKSLVHLAGADYVWLEALLGNPHPVMPGDVEGKIPGNQEGDRAFATFEEFEQFWDETMVRWDQYLLRLNAEQLEEPVAKFSTSSGQGKIFLTRKCDVLLHICTHAQYTVAQVMNMLRQLGVQSLPDVMLISLARHEALPHPQ